MKKFILISALIGGTSGLVCWLFWPQLAVATAPSQKAVASNTPLASQANLLFWHTFHTGNYEQLDTALIPLEAALIENPNDPVLLSHIGWMHIWKISESSRLETISPSIINEMALARHYFAEAQARQPNDPRLDGFLADTEMAMGAITQNEALTRQGYFRGLQSIEDWPEFNGFTVGYVLTGNMPHDSKQFAEGLEMMWANTAACLGEEVDRDSPSLETLYTLKTQDMPERWTRACTNSWIAPYNEEGFSLVLADALVKSGNWQAGVKAYNMIYNSPTVSTWPYRHVLADRIANAEANVELFRKPPRSEQGIPAKHTTMMFNSDFACMGCHQHSDKSAHQYTMPSFVAETLNALYGD